MENINSTADIIKAIQLLEIEQEKKGQLLREQFNLTYEAIKPINILKSTLKEFSSPNMAATVIAAASGLATGYVLKKIIVGTSPNIFRGLAGTNLQNGIVNVARHVDTVKSLIKSIFHRLFHKNEVIEIGSSKALLSSGSTQLEAEPAESSN